MSTHGDNRTQNEILKALRETDRLRLALLTIVCWKHEPYGIRHIQEFANAVLEGADPSKLNANTKQPHEWIGTKRISR